MLTFETVNKMMTKTDRAETAEVEMTEVREMWNVDDEHATHEDYDPGHSSYQCNLKVICRDGEIAYVIKSISKHWELLNRELVGWGMVHGELASRCSFSIEEGEYGNVNVKFISPYMGKTLQCEESIKQFTGNLHCCVGQLLEQLYKLHVGGYVHGDLKETNITIRDGNAYLIDFGLIAQTGRTDDMVRHTYLYRPPEMFHEEYDSVRPYITSACDMWAFGAVLCNILAGESFFPGADRSELRETILDRTRMTEIVAERVGKISGVDSRMGAMIEMMLKYDAKERITAAGAYEMLTEGGKIGYYPRISRSIAESHGMKEFPGPGFMTDWRKSVMSLWDAIVKESSSRWGEHEDRRAIFLAKDAIMVVFHAMIASHLCGLHIRVCAHFFSKLMVGPDATLFIHFKKDRDTKELINIVLKYRCWVSPDAGVDEETACAVYLALFAVRSGETFFTPFRLLPDYLAVEYPELWSYCVQFSKNIMGGTLDIEMREGLEKLEGIDTHEPWENPVFSGEEKGGEDDA